MQPVIDVLPDFQAEPYIHALQAVAVADGLYQVEIDFVAHQAQLLGVEPLPFDDIPPLELDTLGKDCSAVTRRMILRDCIVLSYVDGEFSEPERALVDQICDAMGLDRSLVKRFEDWLHQYDAVLTAGTKLIEEG